MRLNCPNCGEQLSLIALIEHDAAREAFMLALQFPAPLGKQLIQYVSLFKPGQRALSMDRLASLLGEILPMIQKAQIERNSRLWPAPLIYWQQGIETMLASRDKLTLPIKSHGYLLEIIAGYANKAESKQEQKSEQGRKYGPVDHIVGANDMVEKPAGPKPRKPRSEMPAAVRATLRSLTGKSNPKESNGGN